MSPAFNHGISDWPIRSVLAIVLALPCRLILAGGIFGKRTLAVS